MFRLRVLSNALASDRLLPTRFGMVTNLACLTETSRKPPVVLAGSPASGHCASTTASLYDTSNQVNGKVLPPTSRMVGRNAPSAAVAAGSFNPRTLGIGVRL